MTSKRRGAVEIFTDAGAKDGAGAWAVVIERRDGRGGIVEASGMLRGLVGANTELAEAQAIANGLHKAKAAKLIERGEKVVVRCDNQAVVARWRNRAVFKRPPAPELVKAFEVIRQIVDALGCRFEIRGIKGHCDLSKGDRLLLMNARADALCCKALGTKRKGHVKVRDGVPAPPA